LKICSDICPRTLSVQIMSKDEYPSTFSKSNRGYCVYYPSDIFCNTHSFENWGIFWDIPQLQLGNIRSRDAFRPIARERKYLMDYKTWQQTRLAHCSCNNSCWYARAGSLIIRWRDTNEVSVTRLAYSSYSRYQPGKKLPSADKLQPSVKVCSLKQGS